jgi:hypothetical protein
MRARPHGQQNARKIVAREGLFRALGEGTVALPATALAVILPQMFGQQQAEQGPGVRPMQRTATYHDARAIGHSRMGWCPHARDPVAKSRFDQPPPRLIPSTKL